MMSMLKKIVLFPISLFVAFLALMARWLLTLSSYVVAPLMLYIFGCGIYTAYRQTWNQFLILLVAEFLCFVLFFGAFFGNGTIIPAMVLWRTISYYLNFPIGVICTYLSGRMRKLSLRQAQES